MWSKVLKYGFLTNMIELAVWVVLFVVAISCILNSFEKLLKARKETIRKTIMIEILTLAMIGTMNLGGCLHLLEFQCFL